jgi:plastocyanin
MPRTALLLAAALWAAAPASGAATLKGRLTGAKPADLEGYVVWIDGAEDLPPLPREPARVTVNQIGKKFSPRITALRAGDEVVFANLDDVFHNVFSLDKRNPFDVGLYKGSKRFAEDGRTPLTAAGEPVQKFPAAGKFPIYCNIHPDMFGLIYVFAHGYYAQADKDGLFELPVPAGGARVVRVDGPRLKTPGTLNVDFARPPAALEIPVKLRWSSAAPGHTKKDGSVYPSDDAGGY